jgi:hypothetical protein
MAKCDKLKAKIEVLEKENQQLKESKDDQSNRGVDDKKIANAFKSMSIVY